MEDYKIKVYAKLDTNKVIIEINSSIFLQDITGYKEIDEGFGDKYSHSQNQYLDKGLVDSKGRFNYKFITKLMELTEAEKDILFPVIPPMPSEIEVLRQQTAQSNTELFELVLMMTGGTK